MNKLHNQAKKKSKNQILLPIKKSLKFRISPRSKTLLRDIKPIVNTYCVSCHTYGGIGPGNYSLYVDLKAAADNGKIHNRVFVLKDMPQTGAAQLSQDELSKLNCWLKQGAPEN